MLVLFCIIAPSSLGIFKIVVERQIKKPILNHKIALYLLK